MAITPISLISSISSINSINNSINSSNHINSLKSLESMKPVKPINSLNSIGSVRKPENSDESYGNNNNLSFSQILRKMINDTNETNAQTKYDTVNLALGLTSDADLHNIEINAIKADLALRTMVSVRNKVLDAYTEIMRMNV